MMRVVLEFPPRDPSEEDRDVALAIQARVGWELLYNITSNSNIST